MFESADGVLALTSGLAEAFVSARCYEDALHDLLWHFVEATRARGAALFVCTSLSRDHKFVLLASSDDDADTGAPLGEREAALVSETVAVGRERIFEHEAGEVRLHLPLRAQGRVFGVMEVLLAERPAEVVCVAARIVGSLISPGICFSERYGALVDEPDSPARGPEREAASRRAPFVKYREFLERASDGVAVLDRSFRILLFNSSAEQITGYARDGVIGRPFAELVCEDDRAGFLALANAALEGSPRRLFDVKLMTTSDDVIIVSMSTSVLSEHEAMVALSFRDITERRYFSEELRRTKEFLERMIDSAYDAIVATDVSGTVVLFNKVAERVFDRRADDVIGKMSLADLYPSDVMQRLRERLDEPARDYPEQTLRDEIVGANGERIPVQISLNVLYEGGIEMGTVANISDMRDRLRMERQLLQAKERLVETEKQALLAELAGTTAHELNQPLTSIMGYAELLLRRVEEGDPNRRAAEVIHEESRRMAAIVRQIGRITRYETKPYVGNTQILDLEKSSE